MPTSQRYPTYSEPPYRQTPASHSTTPGWSTRDRSGSRTPRHIRETVSVTTREGYLNHVQRANGTPGPTQDRRVAVASSTSYTVVPYMPISHGYPPQALQILTANGLLKVFFLWDPLPSDGHPIRDPSTSLESRTPRLAILPTPVLNPTTPSPAGQPDIPPTSRKKAYRKASTYPRKSPEVIKFSLNGDCSIFSIFSPHQVVYKDKVYKTTFNLFVGLMVSAGGMSLRR